MAVIALGDLPAYQAARRGAAQWAMRFGEQEIAWGELDDRATRRAHALAAIGVGHNDRIALALPNGVALFELCFAAWKLGATPIPLSARMPPSELSAVIGLSGAKAVFADRPAADLGPAVYGSDFGRDHSSRDTIQARVADAWKIMASGGSTGQPKLIVENNPAALDADTEVVGLPKDSVILTPGPCHHNMPFATSVRAMLRGSSVSGLVRFDPEETLALIERDRAEWMTVVPTMMRRIWALPKDVRETYDLSSLKRVVHTAAPIAHWLKRAWIDWLGPERIVEIYGGTEGVGITLIDGSEWLERPGSVGRGFNCSVRILDADGRPQPAGTPGEIFFCRSERQAKDVFRYVGATARASEDGCVSLGDQGWLDEAGYLFVSGRRTDLILRGGANIYPAEIEDVLSECDGVAAVVVIGLPDDDLGERVHAIVEPADPAHPPSVDALKAQAAARLDRYKWPASYEFVPGPLRDAAGKVRRATLRSERTE